MKSFFKKNIIYFIYLIAISNLNGQLNIYSHRHYDSDRMLFDKFTEMTGIEINVVKGSADQLIERLISEGENSPADILLTVDAGRLYRAKIANILEPVNSSILKKNIPSQFRDPENYWFGFSVRARVLVYSKDRVKSSELSTYEDLVKSKWKGRIAVRSSSNIYNQSLMASIIESNGAEEAYKWAKAIRKNMARSPRGSDRDQARAVAAGIADVAIMNTYYIGKLKNSKDPKDREVVDKISVFFPNQNDRGTHVNISGGGLVKTSKNKKDAIKFLEYLSSSESQEIFGNINYEYPVYIKNNKSKLLKSWGSFKSDKINLSILGKRNGEAVKIFDKAGWE
tara:strand:- start:9 stop:1025 length:1017 start_codon:yes stop_codon:yes gene_type:complete